EAVEHSGGNDHGVLQAGALDGRSKAVEIRLGVSEFQGVVRRQVGKVLGPAAVIEQAGQPFGGPDPEVVGALWTDGEIFLEILVIDDLSAVGALDHQPFWYAAGLCRRGRRQ